MKSMEYDPKSFIYLLSWLLFAKGSSLFANVNEDSTGRNPVLSLGRYGFTVEYRFFCIMKRIFFQI